MPKNATAQWLGDLNSGRGSVVAGEALTGRSSFRWQFADGDPNPGSAL